MERTVLSPIGPLLIRQRGDAISELIPGSGGTDSSPLLLEAERQLQEYFAGTRKEFELPLSPSGTRFQRLVWDALCRIPWGETRTYGQIAAELGKPRACRAVGMANKRNPLPIFIPCHRVIGANGNLTGYAYGLDIKRRLLQLEGIK